MRLSAYLWFFLDLETLMGTDVHRWLDWVGFGESAATRAGQPRQVLAKLICAYTWPSVVLIRTENHRWARMVWPELDSEGGLPWWGRPP